MKHVRQRIEIDITKDQVKGKKMPKILIYGRHEDQYSLVKEYCSTLQR